MNTQDFTASILVDKSPGEAFDAINNVRAWWSGDIEGNTSKLDDEFTYRFKEFHYSKQRLVEVIPEKKVVWLVTESALNFTGARTEWTGTKIIFDISPKDGKTEVRFTHQGLTPEKECYDGCSGAWSGYIRTSLRNFIATGKA